MPLVLTENDRRMLDGDRSGGRRLAMRIMVRWAEACGAERLMDVAQAHIDGCGLLSEAGLEFAETLAQGGARVAVPTTLNMGPLDLQGWRDFGVPETFAAMAVHQADAYTRMGCIPTWTCAPYQGYLAPRFGRQIAWGESNAVAYANSVLGARTEMYGDYIDICAAVTGRVPRRGLHLTRNRRGRILVRLVGFEPASLHDDAFWPAFGHLLGPLAGDRVPVIEGLPADASDDQLKALCAAAASSGGVALFHAVGLTPEAPTLDAALQGAEPEETVEVRPADLAAAARDLSTAEEGTPLDALLVGCPHFSFAEFRGLADLIGEVGGRSRVLFIVITSTQSHALAERGGFLDALADFGVRITLDTCMFHTPMLPPGVKVVMTNSGKCAYYAPGELDVKVAFGSLADCVRSAAQGRVVRTGRPMTGQPQEGSPKTEGALNSERGGSPHPPRNAQAGPPRRLAGRAVVPGAAEGAALVTTERLSFWGGLNTATGEIVDRRHERSGRIVTGRIFVLPGGRGSSTASACLLESVRAGTAPAAIITARTEPVLAVGSIIADELYGRSVPMVVLPEEAFASIRDGDHLAVEPGGAVRVSPPDRD